MNKTTIGVFSSKNDADAAIRELKQMGITDSNISYLYENKEGAVGGAMSDAAAGAASGATTGAVIGTVAGLAVAAGVLPGLGALFVAGPLATALGLAGGAATTAAGAMTGAAAGGLIGALKGLGVGADEARAYEERVRGGGILVTTHSDNPGVGPIFEKYHAEDVREY